MVERLGERKAPGETMNAIEAVHQAGVRTLEDDLARVRRDADQLEQTGEARASPSRLGHRAGRPGYAPWGRLELNATVAGALQHHAERASWQASQRV